MVRTGAFLLAMLALVFCSGVHAVDSHDLENFEPIQANNIVKGNVVIGVPNIARLGGSYHRILQAQGRLMYTLGAGGNIGLAFGDQGAAGQKFSVQETYGNIGLLPGVHVMAGDRSILLGLNAVIGLQYSAIEISNPLYLSQDESTQYKINSQKRKEFNIHAGLEAGIYYLANPIFVGIDFGFVATPSTSIAYSITQNDTTTTNNYRMPAIRYSGIRISVTAGFMF